MAVSRKKAENQLSATVSMGSDEDLKPFCQPCDRDGPRLPACGYCTDCKEHLCETCFTLHKRHTLSRLHKLLDKNSMPQSMSTSSVLPSQPENLTKACPKHSKEMIKFYCPNHKAILCSVCVTLEHTVPNCKVNYIPDISGQVMDSKKHHDILTVMDIISEQCYKISEDVKKMTGKSSSSLADLLGDIKKFRKEINQRLDELEGQVEDAAKAIQQKNVKNQKTVETTCNDVTKSLKTSSDTIKHLYTSKQADSLFMELNLAEKMIKDCEKCIQQLSVHAVKDYCFKPNKEITALLKKGMSLGTLTEKPLKQASPPSTDVKSRKTAHQGEICVKTSKDINTCRITGMILVSPDTLILTDCNNKSMKMVNTYDQSVTYQLQLDTSPFDVTSVTSTDLAVTLPGQQTIQFVSVSSNKLTKKHTMKVKGQCYCVSCYQGKLVVLFSDPAKLHIFDISGTILTTMSGRNIFFFPTHVAANASSIYVSDWKMKTCTQLNWMDEMIGSYGRMTEPRGITLSDDGTVFVCDRVRNVIEEISGDCSTGKVVLKDLKGPHAVCWCAVTRKLYCSSDTRNEKHDNFLHIFKMS